MKMCHFESYNSFINSKQTRRKVNDVQHRKIVAREERTQAKKYMQQQKRYTIVGTCLTQCLHS